MAIKLDLEAFEAIRVFGEASFPNECCGFILGRQVNGNKQVAGLYQATNQREENEQYHRFLITPKDYLAGDKEARRHGLDVIGFYHSHPDAPAQPSKYDLDHAWPWYSYIIVSVRDRQAQEMTSWVLRNDREQFEQEPIEVAQ